MTPIETAPESAPVQRLPTPADCDWLATWAARQPLAEAIARIRFNDQPYPLAAWIDGLTAAIEANPDNAATYHNLIARIKR